jgi:hypothetical protein
MTFDIGIRCYNSISNVWNSISNAQNLTNIYIEKKVETFDIDPVRYRMFDIEACNIDIDTVRYRRNVDIEVIYRYRRFLDIDKCYFDICIRYRSFFASISKFVFLDIGVFCRIQPGLPTRYWTQIVVCTLHCKSIITRGACAARAALSRRSRGCTRRRGRTRCSGRSTGRSRRSGARPPGRRPQPPERAPTERRSV